MLYSIDYIYFVFPFLTLAYYLLERKVKLAKKSTIILGMFLIIFLGFSKIGADYNSYKGIYELISSGINLNSIHGEILYKKLNLLFYNMGFQFEVFKSTYVGLLLFLLYFYTKKLSCSISFSLFIVYCFYIIYLCSAFRQLASIVACIVGFYYIKKNRIIVAIIINFTTLFIHSSSMLPLGYFIFLKLKQIKIKNKKNLLIILFFSILFRIFVGVYVQRLSFLFSFVGKEGQFLYYSSGIVLISVGMLARLFVLLILIYNLNIFLKDENIYKIFMYYYLGIIIYTLLPIELLAGRLTNNAKIVEIFLIPYLLKAETKFLNKLGLNILFIFLGLLILINQLFKQQGYYPYYNIYF